MLRAPVCRIAWGTVSGNSPPYSSVLNLSPLAGKVPGRFFPRRRPYGLDPRAPAERSIAVRASGGFQDKGMRLALRWIKTRDRTPALSLRLWHDDWLLVSGGLVAGG